MRAGYFVRSSSSDRKTLIACFIYCSKPKPTSRIRFGNIILFKSRGNVANHLLPTFRNDLTVLPPPPVAGLATMTAQASSQPGTTAAFLLHDHYEVSATVTHRKASSRSVYYIFS